MEEGTPLADMTKQDETVCGRFAPSPSGRMHLGNLWSALLAWLAARSRGGRMVLRLEDLDPDRCTQARCDQVMRDLEWLGLDWDNEPIYQSRRTDVYRDAFAQLESDGLIYPCYCTRAERLAASAPHRSDVFQFMTGVAAACRRRSWPAWPKAAARPGGSRFQRKSGISVTCSRGSFPRICRWIAVILSSAAPTGCTPISWRWWWTTGLWG